MCRAERGVEEVDRRVQRAQAGVARELGCIADEAVVDVRQDDQLRSDGACLERRVEFLRLAHCYRLVERAVDEQERRVVAIDMADGARERDLVVRAGVRVARSGCLPADG